MGGQGACTLGGMFPTSDHVCCSDQTDSSAVQSPGVGAPTPTVQVGGKDSTSYSFLVHLSQGNVFLLYIRSKNLKVDST